MNRSPLVLVLVLAALPGCDRKAPAPAPSTTATAAAAPSTAAPSTAADALDRMDERKPVPLLPMMASHQKANMRDHLVAVQEIVAALATDDFAAVERAAARIGFSEQMGQMCTHMGAAADGFADQAVAFHHTADGIGVAARAKDRGRVLTELGTTLGACTACHASWKQQVVDEATWQLRTGSPPPTHGAM